MIKAFRYLKPFWLSVIAIVALVFAQVQADLALPDYMSRIVTYGIQYGGITSPVSQVLSTETVSHMQYFMSEADLETFNNTYQEISAGDPDFPESVSSADSVYILKDASQDTDGIQKAFLIASVMNTAQGDTDPSAVWAMLDSNPAMAEQIMNMAQEQLKEYTDDNLNALRILMVKNEYTSLGMDTEKIQNDYILHEGLLMLGIALLASLAAMASSFLAARTATGACRNMRDDIFAKVESFSSEEFSRFSTASLITRTTNDVQQVQMIITMMLRIVLFAPMMGLTSLFKVLRYKSLAAVLGWAVLLMIGLMIITYSVTIPKFRIVQKMVDRLNLVIREQLEGMLVIRAFNNQDTEEKRFDLANGDLTKLNIYLNRVMAVISPVMTFIMSTVSILIIWIGARQIDLGAMQIGDMMAFLQYATHVLISFMIVAMIFIMIPRSAVSARRIFEVLETEPVIHDPKEPKNVPEGNQTVTFDHVSFRYPKAEMNVLEDISFEAKPGETVALIGSTGSGKSTLINLLPRFFDVTEGAVRYGGTDIREFSQKDLRDLIGYVPQKGVLFSGTVESNLRYADENASDEAIDNALKVSQAEEFVSRMEHGIEEPISQGGTNVSGGQKQRLSIARALTKQAKIYIFDDTFSALDYQTDAKLREALNKMIARNKATVFIVAQRISTIMHCDRIIVLDQGKVAGQGKHADLMKNCQVYQEIALSQLSREELGYE
ncbi:MAG: ABC transporter ATP-binding protein [Solobacterium sp.]|nr:ABC transporter ATP-binding protein [Solobacterium sp.]